MSTDVQKTGFNLQRMNQGEVQILSFSGGMDNDASGRVDKELAHLLEQKNRRAILDLTMLSSATTISLARFLVRARELHRHGGELKLVGLSSSFRRVAELAGFDQRKDFAPDVATALKAMSQPSEVNPSNKKKT